jgi:glycosyltransferase involved in cell wall biosynthesis
MSADLVCVYPHPFAYSDDALPGLAARLWSRLICWRGALAHRQYISRSVGFVLQAIVRWWVLVWAMRRYDAFVFFAGKTITDTGLELALLRFAGKRVVVVFVGSDARPPYIDGSLFPADQPFDAVAAARESKLQRCKVGRLERGANACINAPATAHFHQRRFVNWFAVGVPREVSPATRTSQEGPVLRLLHSPSHAALKGTAAIRAMVERLNARGLAVELMIIESRPNAEVMQAMRDCDLVVDQLYSDTPMAGFATEGASQGRAVLVGGYRAASVERDLAGLPMPPTCFVAPEDFEGALERLVRDSAARESLGAAARAFVAGQWSHAAVAQRLSRVLRGDVPDAWWCDPARVDHLHGCGLSEAVARAHVGAMVDRCGVSALQLDDKPGLRDAFVAFARDAAASP